MTIEELMLFYAKEGNKEWEAVINGKPYDKIIPNDFAHCEFCHAIITFILIRQLEYNLAYGNSVNKFWAGVRLYENWTISRMLHGNLN